MIYCSCLHVGRRSVRICCRTRKTALVTPLHDKKHTTLSPSLLFALLLNQGWCWHPADYQLKHVVSFFPTCNNIDKTFSYTLYKFSCKFSGAPWRHASVRGMHLTPCKWRVLLWTTPARITVLSPRQAVETMHARDLPVCHGDKKRQRLDLQFRGGTLVLLKAPCEGCLHSL